MNKHKTLLYILAAGIIITASGCRKGFDEINAPYKNSSSANASIPGLYNGLVKSIYDNQNDWGLAAFAFWPIANQQLIQNEFQPLLNFTTGDWDNYYQMLYNYRQLIKLIDKQANNSLFSNTRNFATIIMGYRTLKMLDLYGSMPYSEAARGDESITLRNAKYDDEASVYKSALADLKGAIDGLTDDPNQVKLGNSESFLNNNLNAWKKFGNAIRLRYAVRLYNKEQALASDIINDIIGGNKPLPNNQSQAALNVDNFGIWPNFLSPKVTNFNGKWFRFYQNSHLRLGTNMWKEMTSNPNDTTAASIFDPRCFIYFMPNNAGGWIAQPMSGTPKDGGNPYHNDGVLQPNPKGTDPGNRNIAVNFYLAYDQQDFPGLIITEADVHLLKAEIYNRGLGVAKNVALAKAEYEAGFISSVKFWYYYAMNAAIWSTKPVLPTDTQLATLVTTNPALAYSGNEATALSQIYKQSWIATFMEPTECWALVRRTNATPKDASVSFQVINKLPYPISEENNNKVNWQNATMGANQTAQLVNKVYWMP